MGRTGPDQSIRKTENTKTFDTDEDTDKGFQQTLLDDIQFLLRPGDPILLSVTSILMYKYCVWPFG